MREAQDPSSSGKDVFCGPPKAPVQTTATRFRFMTSPGLTSKDSNSRGSQQLIRSEFHTSSVRIRIAAQATWKRLTAACSTRKRFRAFLLHGRETDRGL